MNNKYFLYAIVVTAISTGVNWTSWLGSSSAGSGGGSSWSSRGGSGYSGGGSHK